MSDKFQTIKPYSMGAVFRPIKDEPSTDYDPVISGELFRVELRDCVWTCASCGTVHKGILKNCTECGAGFLAAKSYDLPGGSDA